MGGNDVPGRNLQDPAGDVGLHFGDLAGEGVDVLALDLDAVAVVPGVDVLDEDEPVAGDPERE